MKEELVDIHSHVLFGVDDGAELPEDSQEILQELYNQGVRHIVATPHRRKKMFDIDIKHIIRNFNNLTDIAEEVASDLKVYLGSEIYYTEDIIMKLANGKIPSLNDTDYVLLEFSKNELFNVMYLAANKVIMEGYIPIIAHIERYDALDDIKKVEDLIELGCYTQVNSSNVVPKKMFKEKHSIEKERVIRFLNNNLVHIVASDVHNLTNRRPYLKEAYEIIKKKYGEKRAQNLFSINPKNVINNNMI